MNKIYIGKRASGKTTLLIKKSAETGAVIVVPTQAMCAYIEEMAHTMNLNITKPITVTQFLYEKGRGEKHKVLVDELQFLLDELGIDAATVTNSHTENISENTDGEYIEELKTMIPKALYDKADDTVQGDQWTACLECVQEMGNAWEELNGKNLVWVPGHYEVKTSADDTTQIGPPLPYPYYHLCYYDKNGCYDEEFGKNSLFTYLSAMFLRNILDKDNPQDETVRLYYHVGKLNKYEITLTRDIVFNLQPGDSYAITGLMWNDRLVRLDSRTVDLFIQNKAIRGFSKNDTMRIQFGNKTFCELKVVATR